LQPVIHVACENRVESRVYPVRREVYRDCLPSPFVFLHAGVERTLPCDRLRIDQPGGQGLQALRPERVDQVRHGQDIMCLMPGPLETKIGRASCRERVSDEEGGGGW